MSILEKSIEVRLSLQRALLGQITPNIRFIILLFVQNEVKINFYFDGLIQDKDYERASCVETEVMADYDASTNISVECVRLDFPAVPDIDGIWVYQRCENY